MDDSADYTVTEVLHRPRRGPVLAARLGPDRREVVLKAYLHERAPDAAESAEREFALLCEIAGPHVVAPLALLREPTQTLLALDRLHGSLLQDWVTHRPALTPIEFLEIGIQISEALTRVHGARQVHLGVHPSNVLVQPRTLEISLLGFSRARPQRSDPEPDGREPELTLGNSRYVSPEQTGRMDRGVDSRSDLYSLGATLYFALSGRPPFTDDDPLALVHAHLARRPRPLADLRPDLPPTLCRIVMRLLAKAPEDRYQLAPALHRDLIQCRDELNAGGAIRDDFELGALDAPHRPRFSGRIYGRERALRTLRSCFEKALAGERALVWVEGDAGMGKSALIESLRSPLARCGGYLASGAFEAYRRDQPYLAFAQALRSLVQQLLTESDAKLEHWSASLGTALGGTASLLSRLVPELGFVIDELPPERALGPLETKLSLTLAVQRLIRTVADPAHPLVLFLDDLHWADAGSRDLLSHLLLQSEQRGLLVVCSFRDADEDAVHPLYELRDQLRSRGDSVEEVSLEALDRNACAELLADALGRSPDETEALAAFVGRRTGNAPLAIQQFVDHLYNEGLLQLDPQRGWVWNEEQVESAEIPESTAALLAARIFRLPSGVAQVLRLASCAGSSFEVERLAAISDLSPSAIETAIGHLCEEGLITPAASGFRFVHDRIRESAQSLLSEEQRGRLRGRAARHILERTEPGELEERAFEIADHLAAATRLGWMPVEPSQFIEVHVRAAGRALRTGAPATTLHYCRMAEAQLEASLWESHAALCFELALHGVDAAHSCREFDEADERLRQLGERNLSRLQMIQVLSRQIRSSSVTQPRQATADLTRQVLRRFGVHWPRSPSRLRMWWGVLRTDWQTRRWLRGVWLRPCPPESLSEAMPLLMIAAAGQSLSMTSYRLVLLAAALALRIYAKVGFLSSPCFATTAYCCYQMRFPVRRQRALRYLELAHMYRAKYPDPLFDPRSDMIRLVYTDAWLRNRHELVAPLRRVSAIASEGGDFEFACLSDALRVALMALIGSPIAEFQRERDTVAWTSYAYEVGTVHAFGSLVFSVLTDGADLEEVIRQITGSRGFEQQLYIYTTIQMMAVGVAMGYDARVLDQAERICADTYRAQVGTHVADFAFLRGAAAAPRIRAAAGAERRTARRAFQESLRDLRRWAQPGSDFVHMLTLLEAERERTRGRVRSALALYAKGAADALSRGHRHHAALAWERRTALLVEQRRMTEACLNLRQSADCYREWGARSKVTAMENHWGNRGLSL